MFIFCSGNIIQSGLQKYLRLLFPTSIYWIFPTHRKENVSILSYLAQFLINTNFQIPEFHIGQNAYIYLLFYCREWERKHKYINIQIISAFRWKEGGIKRLNSD